ncbi:hypothetical protein P154DRAFT_536379 [Amniculicola lignicola CBS 123094]|uniref:Uncharacterized protein n=1 Tax=Amniculicola lignicola CBS 123094 TaxID=1392246 RepID=A0A6A5WE11_9PLEO|nr:hypothetical protein P154DRAFT_536379 [Amniculicola lignicola CBS 123094]
MPLSPIDLVRGLWRYATGRGFQARPPAPNIFYKEQAHAAASGSDSASTPGPSVGSPDSNPSRRPKQVRFSADTKEGPDPNSKTFTKKAHRSSPRWRQPVPPLFQRRPQLLGATASPYAGFTRVNVAMNSNHPNFQPKSLSPTISPGIQAYAGSEPMGAATANANTVHASPGTAGSARGSSPEPAFETYPSVFTRYLVEEKAKNILKPNMGPDYKGTRNGIDYYHSKDAYPECGSFSTHVLTCGHWIEDVVKEPGHLLPPDSPCGLNCIRPNSKYNHLAHPSHNCPQCFEVANSILTNRLTLLEKAKLDEAKKAGVESFIISYLVEVIAARNILKGNITETVLAMYHSNYGRTCKQETPRFPFATPGVAEMAARDAQKRAVAYCQSHSIPLPKSGMPTPSSSPSLEPEPVYGHQKSKVKPPYTTKFTIPQKRKASAEVKEASFPNLDKKPMRGRAWDKVMEEEKQKQAFTPQWRMNNNKRKAGDEVAGDPVPKMNARKLAFGQPGWANLSHAVEMSFGRKRGAEKMDGLEECEWNGERGGKKWQPEPDPEVLLAIDELEAEIAWMEYMERAQKEAEAQRNVKEGDTPL